MIRQVVKVRENAIKVKLTIESKKLGKMLRVRKNREEKSRRKDSSAFHSRIHIFREAFLARPQLAHIFQSTRASRIFLRQSVYEAVKITSALEQKERSPATCLDGGNS